MYQPPKRLPVTALSTLCYCEAAFYYTYVEGVKAPKTEAMLKGTSNHSSLEEEHVLKALEDTLTREVPSLGVQGVKKALREEGERHLESAILKDEASLEVARGSIMAPRKGKGEVVMREVYLSNDDLVGKVDEIRYLPSKIVITDDKSRGTVYAPHVLQVTTYGYLFEGSYHPKLPIHLALRQTGGEVFWRGRYSERDKPFVEGYLGMAKSLLARERPPLVVGEGTKCSKCSLRGVCEYKDA